MSPIDTLSLLLAKLPGLGPRSARRIALYLIRHRERLMLPLATSLAEVANSVVACRTCGNLDTRDPCAICADESRDPCVLCVVEDIADLWAVERSQTFRGRYHVLGGVLSAIEGKGPEDLNIPQLVARVTQHAITEVILATNATLEGQTTAHYITDQLTASGARVSRLAQGIPIGGELDYLDEGTLATAMRARQPF